MGNWRTVNITGTMTARDAAALREYLGYSHRFITPGEQRDPAWDHFGPLSFNRDRPSPCGLNDWPAPEVNRAGNLAERGYDVEDVAETLRELLDVAGSMLLTVHCGGDHETLDCVARVPMGGPSAGRRKPRLVGPRVHLCLSDLTSGPRDACPDPVHDFPLPAGYGDASEAAEKRLARGWENVQCPECGLYGWRPGEPTGDPCDERVPAREEQGRGR